MTQLEMRNLMELIFKEINQTRKAGQEEYARKKKNAFANFEKVGQNLNIDRDKVLLVYLLKHIDGICAYVNGHNSQREDVRGRITDVIVYLCLLWGMIEQTEKNDSKKR